MHGWRRHFRALGCQGAERGQKNLMLKGPRTPNWTGPWARSIRSPPSSTVSQPTLGPRQDGNGNDCSRDRSSLQGLKPSARREPPLQLPGGAPPPPRLPPVPPTAASRSRQRRPQPSRGPPLRASLSFHLWLSNTMDQGRAVPLSNALAAERNGRKERHVPDDVRREGKAEAKRQRPARALSCPRIVGKQNSSDLRKQDEATIQGSPFPWTRVKGHLPPPVLKHRAREWGRAHPPGAAAGHVTTWAPASAFVFVRDTGQALVRS